ncbi:MAG: ATP-binding protein [Actinomycetota bacterium]|nr:ATP-binding protein [Actinomycetota bacterium]
MANDVRSFQVRLPPQPASVGEARRMVRRSLVLGGRDDLVETAELLVSEVVTNALVHAGTPIDVALSVKHDGLRVEIGDESPHLPSRRRYGPTAGTGRGLLMLERLVSDWGVVASRRGKTVWFHLSDSRLESESTQGKGPSTAEDRPGRAVSVELLNVPLLLHAAWQQHAESLLREYLLASLDSGLDEDAIQVHAEASDAMALLAEHIPRPDVGEDASQVMADAVEPKVSSSRVEMPVPEQSISHFDTLNRSLETALVMADTGTFLTPAIQPELRTLRGWLCGEVDAQAMGAAPTPWSTEGHPEPASREAPDWNAGSVNDSTQSLVAADDTSRVIAVSQAVLDLLGYEDRDELVGQRLVQVIPARYRQAHLAGFTMHFLTGRSPLLGRAIVVPALCNNGKELLVELVINSHPVPRGRVVFIAELRRTDN